MKIYDLIVIGGGTSGCAVAYAAGMYGLKVLLIEKNIHLGGAITSGLVVPAMKCGDNQINTEFYNAFVNELKKIGGQITYMGNSGWFNPELAKIALDALMRKASVEVLFSTNVTKVATKDNLVCEVGIVEETLSAYNDKLEIPQKSLLVSIGAKYFVDATGDCEFGKLCGCQFINKKDEFQPVSLRFIMSGVDIAKFARWIEEFDGDRDVTTVSKIDGEIHLSTAYTWDKNKNWALSPLFEDAVQKKILTDSDRNYFQIFTVAGMPSAIAFNCPRIIDSCANLQVSNISKSLQMARQSILRLSNFCKIYLPGFEKSYISNIADTLGIRVSRRIRGKYIYTIEDLKSGRKFENPVVVSNYPIDIHSKDKNASTLEKVSSYELPLESLISADFENLFVAGRCLSADFMAQGALRVQASCFSMGVGLAKYLAKLEGKTTDVEL